ncbi:NAD(P)/FAD-dependent oxidoreductase [Erythrobacter sp. THAF29]|uniref:NAD(P)/FAD-dependent oxidoreductase n=1 Tax=Erythrobacter sp. THAF29 TaxID=2587851 RepID=UPI001268A2B9|nr:FAD-dependent oxidoreductase [Erythrobacter sp. THAF29]QFT78319.1 putative L-tryptophan oxidase VioA [Erythrobacter sp. THAF29]
MGYFDIDICVIGAGMAGLACATRLSGAGLTMKVIDKGRGPGGRMSTRRAEIAGEMVSFDHGAQYFTARNPDFATAVKAWQSQGVVAPWPEAGEDAYVGTPGMNSPIKAMAQNVGVQWNCRASAIVRERNGWRVETEGDDFLAKSVLVAIPAEQAHELLEPVAPDLAKVAAGARSEPCWAVMAGFSQPLDIESDAFRDADARVSWAARNSAKPSRSGKECWVLHASPSRSRELLDLPKEEVGPILLQDFFEQTGTTPVDPIHLAAHRWLYSMAEPVDGEPARFDRTNRIGIAGDYLHSPRVEGAWISGTALAEKMLAEA